MQNTADYIGQSRAHTRKVFFTGNVALVKGQGLCYVHDFTSSITGQAATDPFGGRDKRVALPSASNNRAFAGVTTGAYAARNGGQIVEIAEPGSKCLVAVGVNTTLNSTTLTCSAGLGDPGRFTLAGLPGRGTALALQTSSGQLEADFTGASALDSTGKILTDSAAAFVTNKVAAGDKVFIVSGEDDGTNKATPGEYAIASVDSETQVTLKTAASDGGTMQVSYYCVNGNPLVLCYLLTGEESGLQEIISPIDGTLVNAMVGGKTYIGGGVTLGTGASTGTLADGALLGLLKAFECLGALTTNDYVLTVTNGLQQACDGTSGAVLVLATASFNAAAERLLLRWGGDNWKEQDSAGVVLA